MAMLRMVSALLLCSCLLSVQAFRKKNHQTQSALKTVESAGPVVYTCPAGKRCRMQSYNVSRMCECPGGRHTCGPSENSGRQIYTSPFGGTESQKRCKRTNPVLDIHPTIRDRHLNEADHAANEHMCRHHIQVCDSIREFQENSPACDKLYGNCQSAARHLHKMMFKDNPKDQVCNNFALKSVRGFFHDLMSSAAEGSVLHENDLHMNLGLCKWTQYIAVLSDETMCDPGSIIAMAFQLGYQACGVEIWEVDVATVPSVTINRGYNCGSKSLHNKGFFDEHGQRQMRWDDPQVGGNSTAMEEFYYTIMNHARPDGEVEYSGEAAGAAHIIGRVTCPIKLEENDVNHNGAEHLKAGFFHKARSEAAKNSPKEKYREGLRRWGELQCRGNKAERGQSSRWPMMDEETNFNSEGGLCNMPTQFLGTVRVGGSHRIPRYISIVENQQLRGTPRARRTIGNCNREMKMFLPWEIEHDFSGEPMPSSPALEYFESIAWDGIGTINSAWDSCNQQCPFEFSKNKFCGGPGFQRSDIMTTPVPTPAPTPHRGCPLCSLKSTIVNGDFQWCHARLMAQHGGNMQAVQNDCANWYACYGITCNMCRFDPEKSRCRNSGAQIELSEEGPCGSNVDEHCKV